MIPILYTNDENLFTSNGLGRLSDCISCTVREERNGIFECEFIYPINGVHYPDIKEGCLIYCTHDDSRNPQPFEIYKRSAEINGRVTFNAHHISYRLSGVIVKPFSMTNVTVAEALSALASNAVIDPQFTLLTNKSTEADFSVGAPSSIRERLGGVEGSILDAYGGGEYKWDKFTVTLYSARGADNGVTIRYGKNLTDIKAERSIEGRYTGVVPFWRDDAGNMVTLPEWFITADEMPTINDYWTNEDDTIIRDDSENPFEFNHVIVELAAMDLSNQWESPPTVAQLREKAQSRLSASKAWETEENIDVDFVALWQTPEYEDVAALQRVQLCDTVSVYYPAFDVELKKKVIKTIYNSLLDRYDSIELGMPQSSFADVITEKTVDLMSGYVRSDRMQAAIQNATRLIQGGLGGYVVFNTNADGQPQEILIMDTDSTTTAVNVIRLNKNGIGFSTSGYGGTYHTAWTIDGHFVADFIDTGTLNADLITTGSMSGARITAGTITADKMNVNNLAAISADLGTITAGSISANLITSGTLSADRISGGVIRSDDGNGYWSLTNGRLSIRSATLTDQYISIENGTIYSYYVDKTNSVRISSSTLYFYDPEYTYANAYFTNGEWNYDGASNKHAVLDVRCQKGIVFYANATPALIINNGLNPFGNTEDIIADASTRFKKAVYFNGTVEFNSTTTFNSASYFYATAYTRALTPNSDNTFKIGTSDKMYSEVWTNSVDFATSVYINYNASSDKIYSSKSITQGSDERLKNIYQYDDRYDDLLEDLEPIIYAWKDRPDGSRYVGLGARKTAAILDKHGIKDSGFVGIGIDDKGEEVYGIDYTELSVMLLRKVQKQEKRIKELENTLYDVLKRLEKLEGN